MTEQDKPDWFYIDSSGAQQGPFAPAQFKALADQGLVTAQTMVWNPAYPEWLPAANIDGLVSTPPAAKSVTPPTQPSSPPVKAAPNESAPEPMPAPQDTEHQPRKGSFIFPRVLRGTLVTLGLTVAVVIALILTEQPPLWAFAALPVGLVLTCFAAFVAYRKERYELHPTTILCHRGGLLSEQTAELEIRNITHVKIRLPWLRYKFFKIGHIFIESAGTSKPIVFHAVRNPEAIYADIRERMKYNGYDLSEKELLHEESPALIGVILEVLGLAIATLIALLYGSASFYDTPSTNDYDELNSIFRVLGILSVVTVPAALVIRFLNLKKRSYRVYNDVVVYEEGFLTRENAFIPYENISDAATKRTLLDQILNLYDVLVSCQGSSSEIKFRRLARGIDLSNAIDRLAVLAREKPEAPAPPKPHSDDTTEAVTALPKRKEPDWVAPENTWVADLKMHPARVFVPLLLWLPLIPVWIAFMIQNTINLLSTKYYVRENSLRHSFRFLNTHDREFAYSKITGIVVRQNFWDRLFATVTLEIWSIGSGQSLEFKHIARKSLDLDALLRQLGIPAASEAPLELTNTFSLSSWLRSQLVRLPWLLFFAAVFTAAGYYFHEYCYWLLALVPVGPLISLAYSKIYHARQQATLHPHHIEASLGVISRSHYYARYANVKRLEATRYPSGEEGSLKVFVAGEKQVQRTQAKRDQDAKVGMTTPNSFTLGHLPEIEKQSDRLDDILLGRVDATPEATAAEPLEQLQESPRTVGNALTSRILLSILLVPFIVLLPFTIPLTLIANKRWKYQLEAGRIVVRRGIFYRKQTSILLDRIDSIRQDKGPLNKLFKDGRISIMTAGSSKPDLVMRDVTENEAMYAEIRKLSQSGR